MKNQFKKPFKAFYSIFTINYFRITKKSPKNYLCYFKDNVFYHLFLEIMIFFQKYWNNFVHSIYGWTAQYTKIINMKILRQNT